MNVMVPIEDWPDRLEKVVDEQCRLFKHVTVLRETGSTMDAARRNNSKPSDVIVAWRQTAGKGRLGRAWADTETDGVALTCVISSNESERLAIAAAVGVAHGLETILGGEVGIKWPNDIVIECRKLAGIIIEQSNETALIGVGINVNQTSWPRELDSRAVSLAQLGISIDRLDVLCRMLPSLDSALQMDDESLVREFMKRDSLRGSTMRFRDGNRIVEGIVTSIDPMRGLSLRADETDIWLPAATTTVL